MDFERPDTDPSIVVRTLTAEDLDRLVHIDLKITGRRRRAWYEGSLQRALSDSDLRISLGADVDGTLVGAMLGALRYGEFGQPEPVAVLDTILVDPAFGGQGVARALLDQLEKNLRGLRIERLRTEIAWNEQPLMGFLAHAGFAPVPRLVLEKDLTR